MAYSKYKDALPQTTIQKAKNILDELGIHYELNVSKRMDGIYSSYLVDMNGKWSTCGKGTDEAYCTASALGEAIEHLCNYTAYPMMNLSEEACQYGGFDHYPDEITIPIQQLPEKAPEIFDDLRKSYALANGYHAPDGVLCELLESFFGKEKLTCIPFYSLRKRDICYLPELLLYNLCGSNGGGAGNSPQEAIGHGLDEITERYVKEKVYHTHLTPPDVPVEYIERRCPELLDVIRQIEAAGEYHIYVKDASLGKGFPVVCVVMINKEEHSYLANFGSHPRFEIALERCLTEMFQSYESHLNGNCRKTMTKWGSVDAAYLASTKNWVSILRDDVGYLPDTLFAGEPSWKFQEWKEYTDYSNDTGMKEQAERWLTFAPDILIRDNSYFSIYSYKVYIPGISTTALPFSERHLHCARLNQRLEEWAPNCHELTDEQLLDLMNNYFHPDMFMGSLSYSSMGDHLWNALYASLLLYFNRKKEAIQMLRMQADDYSESAIRVLELLDQGKSAKDIRQLIHIFYKKEYAEFAVCWTEKNVFAQLMENYVLNQYTVKAEGIIHEHQTALNDLHKNLKQKMKESLIDQMGIAALFYEV